jgi:hypothetical protein
VPTKSLVSSFIFIMKIVDLCYYARPSNNNRPVGIEPPCARLVAGTARRGSAMMTSSDADLSLPLCELVAYPSDDDLEKKVLLGIVASEEGRVVGAGGYTWSAA